MWFSELPHELEQAKVCCRQCPLRTACLAGALERAEPYGVWGGEIFHQGAIIARKRPRGRPPRTRPDAGEDHRGRPTAQRDHGCRAGSGSLSSACDQHYGRACRDDDSTGSAVLQ
jgi:Transcription factor WhiB